MTRCLKRFCVFLTVFIILLSVTGCSGDTNEQINCYALFSYQYYPLELNHDGYGGDIFPWWSNGFTLFQSETALPKKTFTYNGTQYTGKYVYSRYFGPCSFYTDFYRAEVEGGHIEVFYNSKTGDEIGFWAYPLPSFKAAEEALPEISDPAREELARQYAAEYVAISEYTCVDIVCSKTKYAYTFSKCINGQESVDSITVDVSAKGQLAGIALCDIGVFTQTHNNAIAVFADADLDALFQSTVPDGSSLYIDSIDKLCYGVTPDGQLVLEALVNYKDHADPTLSDVIDYILALN